MNRIESTVDCDHNEYKQHIGYLKNWVFVRCTHQMSTDLIQEAFEIYGKITAICLLANEKSAFLEADRDGIINILRAFRPFRKGGLDVQPVVTSPQMVAVACVPGDVSNDQLRSHFNQFGTVSAIHRFEKRINGVLLYASLGFVVFAENGASKYLGTYKHAKHVIDGRAFYVVKYFCSDIVGNADLSQSAYILPCIPRLTSPPAMLAIEPARNSDRGCDPQTSTQHIDRRNVSGRDCSAYSNGQTTIERASHFTYLRGKAVVPMRVPFPNEEYIPILESNPTGEFVRPSNLSMFLEKAKWLEERVQAVPRKHLQYLDGYFDLPMRCDACAVRLSSAEDLLYHITQTEHIAALLLKKLRLGPSDFFYWDTKLDEFRISARQIKVEL